MKIFKKSNGRISSILVLLIIVILLCIVFFVKKNYTNNKESNKILNYEEQAEKVKNDVGLSTNQEVDSEMKNLGVKDSNDSEDSKDMFNSQFETYKGDILGTKVKSLIAMVISNNSMNKVKESSEEKIVSVKSEEFDNVSDTSNLTKLKVSIENSKQYHVELEYNENEYVSRVIITAL